MSNAAVQAAANATNAQAAALNFLAGNVSAQAALAGAGAAAGPPQSSSGVSAAWTGINGSFPFFFDLQMMPQIYLYGDAGSFDLNLTDFTLLPIELIIDDTPRKDVFKIYGLLADASDNPY